MQKLNDLSRCLTPLEPDSTLIAVICLSSWLVAGIVPGVERQPLKKLAFESHGPRGSPGQTFVAPKRVRRHALHHEGPPLRACSTTSWLSLCRKS